MKIITEEMRDQAARLASRLWPNSDTRAALNRIAFSPDVESIADEDWRLMIDDANREAEGMLEEFPWLTDRLNGLAKGCDGTLQPPPMTPEGVGALLNAMHAMSEAELCLMVDRAVATQKAQGYSTFAEFIVAMVKANAMAKIMAEAPQLTITGICGPDD
jgi:hypothetical protein